MKSLLGIIIGLVVLLGHSVPVRADMFDVITIKLNEGCTVSQASKIVADLNAYAKDNGGVAYELLTPLHGPNQGVLIAVGRHPNVAAFGAWADHFLAQSGDSAAGKTRQQIRQCASIVNRASAVSVK
jgi:hypothetical protein